VAARSRTQTSLTSYLRGGQTAEMASASEAVNRRRPAHGLALEGAGPMWIVMDWRRRGHARTAREASEHFGDAVFGGGSRTIVQVSAAGIRRKSGS